MKMMGNELQYITLDGTLVDTLLREGERTACDLYKDNSVPTIAQRF